MWYAGIDWADTKHDVLVLDERGHRLGVRQVPHSVEGLQELSDFLTAITGPNHKEEMACIVETNHGLLITALLEAGFAVYAVNPKTIDRKRSASGAKTDRIDAYLRGPTWPLRDRRSAPSASRQLDHCRTQSLDA